MQIELVDTPPLTAEHVPTGLMGTIRNAGVVCVVVEAGDTALEQVEMVEEVLRERGLTLRSAPRTKPKLAEVGQRPGLIVLNEVDSAGGETIAAFQELFAGKLETVTASARTKQGLDALFRRLWELLAMVRVYSKAPGQPAQMQKPFVLPAGSTIADLARLIHRDLPCRTR